MQHLLLTTAVAKMAAMPACCGRSWMSERSASGYSDSSFTAGGFWVTRLSGGESWARGDEEEEPDGGDDREARSLSPAASSLVTLQNNFSPGNTQAQVTNNDFHQGIDSWASVVELGGYQWQSLVYNGNADAWIQPFKAVSTHYDLLTRISCTSQRALFRWTWRYCHIKDLPWL